MCIDHATVLQAGLMMYVNVKQVIQFLIKVSCLAPLGAKVVGFKQAKHLQSL